MRWLMGITGIALCVTGAYWCWWSLFGPGTCGVCGQAVDNSLRHYVAVHGKRR